MEYECPKTILSCQHMSIYTDDDGLPMIMLSVGSIGMAWCGDIADLVAIAAKFDTIKSDYFKRHFKEVTP